MIRKAEEMRLDKKFEWLGGKGEVDVIHIMEKEELQNKGRFFALNVLRPGTSIGTHPHYGEIEAYYVTKGEGLLEDDGVKKPIKVGELGYLGVGKSHSIENTGDTNLEFIALILFE